MRPTGARCIVNIDLAGAVRVGSEAVSPNIYNNLNMARDPLECNALLFFVKLISQCSCVMSRQVTEEGRIDSLYGACRICEYYSVLLRLSAQNAQGFRGCGHFSGSERGRVP